MWYKEFYLCPFHRATILTVSPTSICLFFNIKVTHSQVIEHKYCKLNSTVSTLSVSFSSDTFWPKEICSESEQKIF